MAEGKHEASVNSRKAGTLLFLTEAQQRLSTGQVTVRYFARTATSFFFQLMYVGFISGEKEEVQPIT